MTLWLRRGRKIASTRVGSRARALAFAALLAAAPLAKAQAAPPVLAARDPSALPAALRAAAHPPVFAASTTAAAHRIPLPDGAPLELRLSNLEGTIEVRTRSGAPLHARLSLFSTPCHAVDPARDEVILQCANGRIDASIANVKGHRYLDLRELRGLPTDAGDEGPPQIAYPPDLFGFGTACPGDTDAARGECAFDSGQDAKAEAAFRSALKQEATRRFAALRLGDLALRRRDPDTALLAYLQAGDQGLWGRLALERLCEMTGSCFDDGSMAVFDASGLPEPLRTELAMREIRMLFLLQRWGDATERLSNLLDVEVGSCLGDTKMLCRRMTLAALRAPACPREAALSTYLRLPGFLGGPLAADLARAAAADSGELGAPAYGAALLSATVRLAARRDLLAHAQEAVDLYRSAGDPFRAHVMWSWASTHLSAQELREMPPDAPALAPQPPASPGASPLAETAEFENDQGASALAIARSTLVRSKLAVQDPPPPRKRR